jgi:hypothetical protein
VQCRGIVKSLFAPEIVRNRDNVRPGRLSDITGTGAIEAALRKDPNRHLKEALPRGLTAVTGRPGFGGYHSVRTHGDFLPHAVDYKTGIELYQSNDL